jgi:Amt family ammonium transporter
LNGALAGLVGITAPCAVVTPASAIAIGAIGGAVMYYGVGLLDTLKIDDPIGAVSVHGFCGVWGTLAVGIFHVDAGLINGGGADQLISQIIGVAGVGVFVIGTSLVLFGTIKAVGLLRVSEEGEIIGLDIYEHGMVAYPEFTNSPSEPVPFDSVMATRIAKPSAKASLREAAGD